MHAVSTNQIADILHFNDKDTYQVICVVQRPVWLNGWVFVYELSGSGFESYCCHLMLQTCCIVNRKFKKKVVQLWTCW